MKNFSVTVIIMATDESNSLIKTVEYIMDKCTEKIDKTIIILSQKASPECIEATVYLKNRYTGKVESKVQIEPGLGNAAAYAIKDVKTTHMTFFPADLAIELECLDRMISIAKNNPSYVVKSSRWIQKGAFIGYNKSRLRLNRLAQRFLQILFATKLTELTSPVQLIPTEYEQKVNWQEKGFSTLIEHTIVPIRLGYECVEVPAKCLPRTEGKSKNSVFKTALYLKTALRIRFVSKNKLYKK